MNLLHKMGFRRIRKQFRAWPADRDPSIIVAGSSSQTKDLNQERLYRALTRGMKPCNSKF